MIATIVSRRFRAVVWGLAMPVCAVAWRWPALIAGAADGSRRELASISESAHMDRFQHACRRWSASRPATARCSPIGTIPARGRAGRTHRDPGARLVRLEPQCDPCAVASAGRARRRDLTRSTFAATANRARAATSLSRPARGRHGRFRRGDPQDHPTAPLTLIGHSAGGGFALRVAASPIQNLFARTVLLAPYLGYDAPTNRPRCRRLGQRRHSAPHRARGAAPDRVSTAATRCRRWPSRCRQIPKILTPTYSYRLMRNFAYRWRLSRRSRCRDQAAHDLLGADDELMVADNMPRRCTASRRRSTSS